MAKLLCCRNVLLFITVMNYKLKYLNVWAVLGCKLQVSGYKD